MEKFLVAFFRLLFKKKKEEKSCLSQYEYITQVMLTKFLVLLQ